VRLAAVAVVVAAVAACHPQPRRGGPRADAPDAPYRLADDDDRGEQRDRLAALAVDDPQRPALRATIATAIAARLDDELARGRLRRAHRYGLELLALWRDDPARLAVEGAALVPSLVRARDKLARAGVDDAALVVMVTLAEADPTGRTRWLGEVDEVLAFADDLSRAQGGEHAIRARSIPALAPIVAAFPAAWVVDRYVELVTARQIAVNELLLRNGATIELVQAHHDVLEASHQIAGALARGGRIDELIARLSRLTALGAERPLIMAAIRLGADRKTPEPWRILAAQLRDGRRDDLDDDDDPGAAYAVCKAGLAARPRDPVLLSCAAEHATADGQPQVAIGLLERLFVDGSEDEVAAGQLAGLYRDRIGQLGFAGRLSAARQATVRLDKFVAGIAGRVPVMAARGWKRDGQVVLARALISQGHVDEATKILNQVADQAPTVEALEALATIEADRGQLAAARARLEQAIDLGGEGVAAELVRGRLHRLAGDAAQRSGDNPTALKHYVAALSIWTSLSGDETARIELPPAINGLRLVESGRALWAIGEHDKAVDVLVAGLTVDPDGEETHLQVVAFLILNHRLPEATAAFHRALAAEQIGDEAKVYMALWLLGEDRRAGEEPDPNAVEFLESRRGSAWADELARAATGRLEIGSLRRTATSPTERAELAFYTATLDLGSPPPERVRALLEEVVDSDLILGFEREAARVRLSAP
jgi:tetratricopeptide (TPR) repeat protein